MYLPTLTDEELLRYAHQTQDPLVTSELEIELAKRLELRVYSGHDDMIYMLDKRGISAPDDLMAFLNKVDALKEKAEEL